MKTHLTGQTGIEIRRTHEGRWRHLDTNAGRRAELGPDYHTRRELLDDHERFLRAHGWLQGQVPPG